MTKTRSLTTILLAFFAGMGLLMAIAVALGGWTATKRYFLLQGALEANGVSDHLLAAAGQWAVERGATNTALSAATPAAPAVVAAIATRRQNADRAFEAALGRLRAIGREGMMDPALAALQQRLARLRTEVDDNLRRDRAARDAALLQGWVPAITELIEASQKLRLALERVSASPEMQLANFQVMKHNAWVMSEFAGRERAQIGGLISSAAPIPPDRLRLLSQFRGRVELAWTDLTVKTESVAAESPDLARAMEAVRATFLTKFEGTRTAVYAAGLRGEPYPLAAGDWIAASTEAIDTILALSDAISAATVRFSLREESASLDTLVACGALALVALVVIVLGLWYVVRRVIAPIRLITGVMARVASGDTTVEVPLRGRKDEIGSMADALGIFRENLIQGEMLRAEQATAKERAELERKAELRGMADRFERTVGQIVTAVSGTASQMKSAATALSDTAQQTNHQARSVASAASEATGNVQMVAAASEQLSASIKEIGQQMEVSTRIAAQASDQARQTDGKVAGLAAAASKVGEVVAMISGIAAQTNLLALNATIEAARAGEAGKGFAVVASEVKALATQTTRATEEISTQIGAIQQSSNETVSAIRSIGGIIDEMKQISGATAAGVEEQGAATREIAVNVQHAASGTGDVDRQIGGVAKASADVGAAATQVLASADALSLQAESLRREVDAFVQTVRTA